MEDESFPYDFCQEPFDSSSDSYDIYDNIEPKDAEYYFERTRHRKLMERDGCVDPRIEETLESVRTIFLVLTAILGLLDLVIMATIFKKKARKKTSSWFIYHLTAVDIVTASILHPLSASHPSDSAGTQWCIAIQFLKHFNTFLVNTCVLCINVETIFGILARYRFWTYKQTLRVSLMVFLSWTSSIFILGYVFATGLESCPTFSQPAFVVLHLFGHWAPGALLILGTFIAVVVFVKKRPDRTVTQERAQRARAREGREWLILLILMNSFYFVFHVVATELIVNMIHVFPGVLMGNAYLDVVKNVAPLCLPLFYPVTTECRRALRHFRRKACHCMGHKQNLRIANTSHDQNVNVGHVSGMYV